MNGREHENGAANDGGEAGRRGRRSAVIEMPRDPRAIVIIGPPNLVVRIGGSEHYTSVKLYVPSEDEERQR